jgi:hypothetical protein
MTWRGIVSKCRARSAAAPPLLNDRNSSSSLALPLPRLFLQFEGAAQGSDYVGAEVIYRGGTCVVSNRDHKRATVRWYDLGGVFQVRGLGVRVKVCSWARR